MKLKASVYTCLHKRLTCQGRSCHWRRFALKTPMAKVGTNIPERGDKCDAIRPELLPWWRSCRVSTGADTYKVIEHSYRKWSLHRQFTYWSYWNGWCSNSFMKPKVYPLVMTVTVRYWKYPIYFLDFPMKNGDVPWFFVGLPGAKLFQFLGAASVVASP